MVSAYQSFKYVIDRLVGLLLLLVFMPIILLLLFLLIITQNRIGIFFIQERVGLDARLFKLIKFKTLLSHSDEAVKYTPLGKWLRQSHLDELPQLMHLITGQMSLVGPRPLLPEYMSLYTPEQARRHQVKPGLLSWSHLKLGNNATWAERLAADVEYVERQSFGLDMRILIMSIARIASFKGDRETPKNFQRFTGNN